MENHYSEVGVDCKVYDGFPSINVNDLKKKTFSCIFFNITSLRKHWNNFVQQIQSVLLYIDIIVLNEINIQKDENENYKLNGFHPEFVNRTKRRGGGIAIFVTNRLKCKIIPTRTIFYESLYLEIVDDENKIKKYIYAIYRPPGLSVKKFLEEMSENLKYENDLMVLGDANINIHEYNINVNVRKYMEMMASKGLTNVIRKSTHKRLDTSTLIDHIFMTISTPDLMHMSLVVKSDVGHCPIMYGTMLDSSRQTTRMSEKIDQRKVNQLIKKTNWQQEINDHKSDVESLYNRFVNLMKDIYDQSKSVGVGPPHDPWITPEIIEHYRIRDRLHRRWMKNSSNNANEVEYKRFQESLDTIIQNKKANFYKAKLSNAKFDTRETWKVMNQILGTIRHRDPETMEHRFSDSSSLAAYDFNHLITPAMSTRSSFHIAEASESEVLTMLRCLEFRRAIGVVDSIRALDLQTNAAVLAPVIQTMFNLSLSQEKKPEDYMPIFMDSILSWCLEEIVVNRLNDFIEKRNLLQANHCDFRKDQTTDRLLAELSNVVTESLNEKHHVLVMFVDLNQALNLSTLIKPLNKIGIRGNSQKWIETYLTAKIKSTSGGIPQDSKLGRILLMLFTNDLLCAFKQTTCVFPYADNIAIVVKHERLAIAIKLMQKESDQLSKWCRTNSLLLNADKLKLMHIRTRKQGKLVNSLITFGSEPIEVVETFEYLGLTIDDHFIWAEHIDKLRSKIQSALFAIVNLKTHSTTEVQMQVYYTLVESYLKYGILAWGSASKMHLNKLINLQRKIVNAINITKFNLRILDVEHIFQKTAVIEYYSDQRFQKLASHAFNTRSKIQEVFQVSRHNNMYGKRQLSYVIPSLLNELPRDLKNIEDLKEREDKIEKYFLDISTI